MSIIADNLRSSKSLKTTQEIDFDTQNINVDSDISFRRFKDEMPAVPLGSKNRPSVTIDQRVDFIPHEEFASRKNRNSSIVKTHDNRPAEDKMPRSILQPSKSLSPIQVNKRKQVSGDSQNQLNLMDNYELMQERTP